MSDTNSRLHRGSGKNGGLGGGPISMLAKGIATGIGLASESIHHHKEKKRAHKEQTEASRSGEDIQGPAPNQERRQDEIMSREMDEAAWELDDAQTNLEQHSNSTRNPTSPGDLPQLAEDFLQHHPPPPSYDSLTPLGQLQLPVVITQRRPKERTRGFIRAYAPELENIGIDQDTFLDFLEQLNKAVEPSPWIQAINLASFAGQAVPEPFTMLIAIATKMVTDAASEVHSRTKTNSFLDRVNEDFFKPRGVIALLLTWKPTDPNAFTTADFDLGSTIAKEGGSRSGISRVKHSVQSSAGATEFEFPMTAPLIFPDLDQLAVSGDGQANEKKASVIKRSGKFVGEYMDKRAQAEWAGQNPDSQMANAAPKPEFYSRYADPNHPASSGDPVALLTGGYISIGRGIGGLRGGLGRGLDRGISRDRLLGMRGVQGSSSSNPPAPYGMASGSGPLSLISGVKKLFQTDVLYLMIVNRPTEQQMNEAAERLRTA